MTEREQKLVNIIFSTNMITAKHYTNREMPWRSEWRDQHMDWVAAQLREHGFDTQPMGMSWGILK